MNRWGSMSSRSAARDAGRTDDAGTRRLLGPLLHVDETPPPALPGLQVEPDSQNLEAGRMNFARHGYDGTFIRRWSEPGSSSWNRFMMSTASSTQRSAFRHSGPGGRDAGWGRGIVQTRLVDQTFVSHIAEPARQSSGAPGRSGMRVEVSSEFDFGTTSFDGFVFASRPALPPCFRVRSLVEETS